MFAVFIFVVIIQNTLNASCSCFFLWVTFCFSGFFIFFWEKEITFKIESGWFYARSSSIGAIGGYELNAEY